jgi:hypothetical protein
MTPEVKLFSALSKTQISDLTQAKSQMSTKYLLRQPLVRGVARSFRAAANRHAERSWRWY